MQPTYLEQENVFVSRQPEKKKNDSPRGGLLFASCQAGAHLAEKVVLRYRQLSREAGGESEIAYLEGIDFRFSDGETCVRLDQDVNGRDVFLFQALQDPLGGQDINHNYLAFLIAARTFRQWGANHVTGVLPYLAYSRQDKPTQFQREPTTVELLADLSIEAGLDRLVVWHPHMDRVHGFYGSVPVDALGALPLFFDLYRRFQDRDEVIVVAPDAGALKFVMALSRALNISSAVASKYRPKPEQAVVSEIMGDFQGKRIALVLDDMINTGGTMMAAVEKLVDEKGIQQVYLGVSHNLGTDLAQKRLRRLADQYGLEEVVVTDSIPQTQAFQSLPFLTVVSLADILSHAVNRIHHNRSVDGITAGPAAQMSAGG